MRAAEWRNVTFTSCACHAGRTTPQEDEEMLQAAASNPDDGAFDPRIVSAIVYRLERKRLLETCQLLLNLYLKA